MAKRSGRGRLHAAKLLFQFRVAAGGRSSARRICEERIIQVEAATDDITERVRPMEARSRILPRERDMVRALAKGWTRGVLARRLLALRPATVERSVRSATRRRRRKPGGSRGS